MITNSDVSRLLQTQTAGRSVLSLYLRIPKDPAELRELAARAAQTLAAARSEPTRPVAQPARRAAYPDEATPVSGPGFDHDEQQVRKLLEAHGRDWLGHSAAIFVSGEAGLAEAFALPCEVPDRAVVAVRPHVRPLLVALQRCPLSYVVIADRRHAWLLRMSGDEIETAGRSDQPEEVRSRGFGGWYGLDSHTVNERVIGLAHQHYQATAALLEEETRPGGHEPIVIGGHEDTVAQFTAVLPAPLRDRLAGSFRVDPHTMTWATVRQLARPIVSGWVRSQEDALVVAIRQDAWRHDPLTVTGLLPSLAAVSQHAVSELIVPVGGVVPGFVCQRCGVLSSTGADCPHGPSQARWVPDLLEEMVVSTISDGGQAEAVYDPPGDVAAHLRFPVVQGHGR